MEIFGGDGDRYAEIGHDEFHRGVSAALRLVFVEEPQLLFLGQVGIAAYFGEILLECR